MHNISIYHVTVAYTIFLLCLSIKQQDKNTVPAYLNRRLPII